MNGVWYVVGLIALAFGFILYSLRGTRPARIEQPSEEESPPP